MTKTSQKVRDIFDQEYMLGNFYAQSDLGGGGGAQTKMCL